MSHPKWHILRVCSTFWSFASCSCEYSLEYSCERFLCCTSVSTEGHLYCISVCICILCGNWRAPVVCILVSAEGLADLSLATKDASVLVSLYVTIICHYVTISLCLKTTCRQASIDTDIYPSIKALSVSLASTCIYMTSLWQMAICTGFLSC